ncbi:D-alanyl-D-alanine dipeptidase [Microbispora rosea subsp. aerata]|nr:M15 family metallopeptidase [Microbispora rosea]GGO07118.1 D-alanyl-D-alanine dipeptidase [Microbispora rosea subsp. aerata]GIH53123.1 D-alanyl-D-alanine dipeptidase [Microbispora rosea subsp. aerata]GLJ83967.1 D-alanyl-D-alanine dipeptidase [Microbispora rosea subsp. aerata]
MPNSSRDRSAVPSLTEGPVLISDPRVTSIAVDECGDKLSDVRGRLRVDGRLADPDGAYAHLREGLLVRLEEAQELLPAGFNLVVVEGYRPPKLQTKYFEEYKDELRATFPHMSDAELHVAASRYVSPIEVAPHTAGAAVDLTLCDDDGVELDMGTAVNATPEQSGGACYTDAPVGAEARHNREVLRTALEAVGLVNYPTEWWHWSYGDRYWAMVRRAPAALYGPVEL